MEQWQKNLIEKGIGFLIEETPTVFITTNLPFQQIRHNLRNHISPVTPLRLSEVLGVPFEVYDTIEEAHNRFLELEDMPHQFPCWITPPDFK